MLCGWGSCSVSLPRPERVAWWLTATTPMRSICNLWSTKIWLTAPFLFYFIIFLFSNHYKMQIFASVWWIYVRTAQHKNELKSKNKQGVEVCAYLYLYFCEYFTRLSSLRLSDEVILIGWHMSYIRMHTCLHTTYIHACIHTQTHIVYVHIKTVLKLIMMIFGWKELYHNSSFHLEWYIF
jgi:hypothetical protein